MASCHVESIITGTVNGTSGRKKCQAIVTINDRQGNVVAGATVTGTFEEQLFTEQTTAITDSNGMAVLVSSGQVPAPSFNFCVDDVSDAELSYAPEENITTCDS